MFSSVLKELRKSKNITQEELAQIVGVERSTVGKWESKNIIPPAEMLVNLSKVFETSIDYLLYGFNKTELTLMINLVRHQRSIKEFSNDTGLDEFYLNRLCSGVEYEQPSITTMAKIAGSNKNDWLVSAESLFNAAGYDLEKMSGDLLEDIPLELLHHYQEQGMTEAEMVVAYINFREAERQDAMAEPNNIEKRTNNEPTTIAAHHDDEERTEEELDEIEKFKEFVKSKRRDEK